MGQATIWTIHIQAYCNELPTALAFSLRISVRSKAVLAQRAILLNHVAVAAKAISR
jgi:hypothetical protein